MAGERPIVELVVGDVDLVEGLWKELVGHHRELTDHTYPVRDTETAWRRRRGQYIEWLEAGDGHLFLVPGEGAEGAPLAMPSSASAPPGRPGTSATRSAIWRRSR